MGKRQPAWKGGGDSSYSSYYQQPSSWQLWKGSWGSPRGKHQDDDRYDAGLEDWPGSSDQTADRHTGDTENSARLRAVQQALTRAKKADQRIRKIAEEEKRRTELWQKYMKEAQAKFVRQKKQHESDMQRLREEGAQAREQGTQAAAMVQHIVLMQNMPQAACEDATMTDPDWEKLVQESEETSVEGSFLRQAMQFAAMNTVPMPPPAGGIPHVLPKAPAQASFFATQAAPGGVSTTPVGAGHAPPGVAPMGSGSTGIHSDQPMGSDGNLGPGVPHTAADLHGPFVGSPMPAATHMTTSPTMARARPSPGQQRQSVKARKPPAAATCPGTSLEQKIMAKRAMATMLAAVDQAHANAAVSSDTAPSTTAPGAMPAGGAAAFGIPNDGALLGTRAPTGEPPSLFAEGPVPVADLVNLEDDDNSDLDPAV